MNNIDYNLSIEKIFEYFYVNEIDMNKKSIIGLLKLFNPELTQLSQTSREFIANNLFSPDERKRFYQRGNGHYFMETLKRRLI